jgi:phosphate transport system substrate-binding protein
MNMTRSVTLTILAAVLVAGPALAATTITINGSTTVLPIAQKAIEAYMKAKPEVSISLSGGGSGNGVKALIDGTTDIANSSRFLKDEEIKLAVEKGRFPVPFAIAYDCVVPMVHPSNPLSNLTIDQLKAIYTGEVKNWKGVGGADGPIVVISRDTSSGTYEVWEGKILKGAKVTPDALLQASSGAVVQAVSSNKNAIGYDGIGYLNKSIKALSINGIAGSAATALNGSFPVSRPLFMFTAGWPKGELLLFINWMLNPTQGQKYVKDAGFVPLY